MNPRPFLNIDGTAGKYVLVVRVCSPKLSQQGSDGATVPSQCSAVNLKLLVHSTALHTGCHLGPNGSYLATCRAGGTTGGGAGGGARPPYWCPGRAWCRTGWAPAAQYPPSPLAQCSVRQQKSSFNSELLCC